MYDEGYISKLDARERYNQYIMTILGEFFANEKKPNLQDQPTPVRDAFEEYIFGVMEAVQLEQQLSKGQQYLSLRGAVRQVVLSPGMVVSPRPEDLSPSRLVWVPPSPTTILPVASPPVSAPNIVPLGVFRDIPRAFPTVQFPGVS